MSSDTTEKFLLANEKRLSMQKRKDLASESDARRQSVSDIEKYTKKNKMAFSQFEINMASAGVKLKEKSEAEDGDPQIGKVVDGLDALKDLNGKSNQDQKVGLSKLEGLNTQIANVNDKATREFLQEQSDLLKEGLSKQSNLTSTIAEKFDNQADNIGGAFGAVLGNSPLAGMVTKFFIKSIRDGFKRRADVKLARADSAKDAAKAIHGAREIVEAVEEDSDKVQKVEIVGQGADDKKGRDSDKKGRDSVKAEKESKSPKIVEPKKPTLLDEEKRREANSAAIHNSASKVSKPKKKGFKGLGLVAKLLGVVLGSTLGGVAMKVLSPLVGAVSSMVRFVPTALKGLASLIPGVNLDSDSTGKDGKKKGKSPKQVKPKGKGSFLGRMVKGAARMGGTLVRGGAALLGGTAGAVAGAGALGYMGGTAINDNLLTNEDGSGKISNGVYDFLNPQSDEERKTINKGKYLHKLNELTKAGATPKEAKSAMSKGKYKETLQMLRMKKANKENVKVSSLGKVDAMVSTAAEVRVLDKKPTESAAAGANIVNAPNNTVVNNNSTTITRQRPHLSNSDTSFIAANMSGAM